MKELNNKNEHIELFINYLRIKQKSENTIKGYKVDLCMFYDFLLSKHNFNEITPKYLDEISLSELDEFLSYSKDKKSVASSTQNRRKSSLQAYFKYLVEYDYIKNNMSLRLQAPKIEKRLPVYMTLNESKQLLNIIDDNIRDKAIITLFLNCGLRLSELISININDINFETKTMKIVGKGDKQRTIYLNDACIKILQEYLQERKDIQKQIKNKESKNALFLNRYNERISKVGVERIVKKYIERLGLDKHITPHKLRHTFATIMFKYGNVDIRKLQEILGHSNVNTTTIYTHVDNQQLHDAVQNNPLNDVV